MNRELPDVQAGFRKGRGTRDQIANICWIIEKVREFPKIIYICFIDYAKAYDCVDHSKLENAENSVLLSVGEDFPGGPVVRNPPSNIGSAGLTSLV